MNEPPPIPHECGFETPEISGKNLYGKGIFEDRFRLQSLLNLYSKSLLQGIINLPDPDPDPGPLKYRTTKIPDPTEKAHPTKIESITQTRPVFNVYCVLLKLTLPKDQLPPNLAKLMRHMNEDKFPNKNSILTTPYDVRAFY